MNPIKRGKSRIRNIFWVIFLFTSVTTASAQQAATEESVFTYIGVTCISGFNMVHYHDWVVDHRTSGNGSGLYFGGGPVLDVFVRQFIGEFSIQFINNPGYKNKKLSVAHMLYTASGKFAYNLNKIIFLTSGAGLYFESEPANKNYNGGGGAGLSTGIGFAVARDWRLLFDITGRYGVFGIGEEATKLSIGLALSAVYKIGRL
jgi:hypothetical protein